MTSSNDHRLHLPVAGNPGSGSWAQARPADAADTASIEEVELRVGELAKATGKTVRAIHHYEQLGLLTPSARSKGRYRLYDGAGLLRVRWIAKLQELGLSLGDIRDIVAKWETAESAAGGMATVRATYAEKLAETRAQIRRLQALECELAATMHYLETCESCDPSRMVNSCSACREHAELGSAPELLRGLHAGHSAVSPVTSAQAPEEACTPNQRK